MPDKGTILKLKNYNRSKSVPFAVYLVFESFIKSLSKALIVRQAVIRISQINNKSINHVGYFASMISSIRIESHSRSGKKHSTTSRVSTYTSFVL